MVDVGHKPEQRRIARAEGEVARWRTVKMTQDLGAFALGVLLAWRAGLGAAAPFARPVLTPG